MNSETAGPYRGAWDLALTFSATPSEDYHWQCEPWRPESAALEWLLEWSADLGLDHDRPGHLTTIYLYADPVLLAHGFAVSDETDSFGRPIVVKSYSIASRAKPASSRLRSLLHLSRTRPLPELTRLFHDDPEGLDAFEIDRAAEQSVVLGTLAERPERSWMALFGATSLPVRILEEGRSVFSLATSSSTRVAEKSDYRRWLGVSDLAEASRRLLKKSGGARSKPSLSRPPGVPFWKWLASRFF